jgi:hypothetical protein
MNNINDEINDLKNTVPEETKWLSEPYVGMVQVKDVMFSDDLKVGANKTPYTGSPFFKFLIATRDGERVWLTFWRSVPGGDEAKNQAKKEKIKTFLDNAEADTSKEGRDFLKSIIGNKLQMVIKKTESWATNKNGIPQIFTQHFYSYSKKKDENLEQDASNLYYRMSEADLEAFHKACEEFTAKSGKTPEEALGNAINQSAGKDFEESKPTVSEIEDQF